MKRITHLIEDLPATVRVAAVFSLTMVAVIEPEFIWVLVVGVTSMSLLIISTYLLVRILQFEFILVVRFTSVPLSQTVLAFWRIIRLDVRRYFTTSRRSNAVRS